MIESNRSIDLSEPPARGADAEVALCEEPLEAYLRLRQSTTIPDTSKTLIWAGLGLILMLFFAFLLTTRWFGN